MPKVDKNKDKKAKFLEYFKDVPIQKYAGMHIGVSEHTIVNWKKKDLHFSHCIDELKADWVRAKLGRVK